MAMTAIVGPPTYPAPMHAMRFVNIIMQIPPQEQIGSKAEGFNYMNRNR
jgi:hypothetical protein